MGGGHFIFTFIFIGSVNRVKSHVLLTNCLFEQRQITVMVLPFLHVVSCFVAMAVLACDSFWQSLRAAHDEVPTAVTAVTSAPVRVGFWTHLDSCIGTCG